MKNKIEDLRNHLFAALEGLSDKDNPMELDRAKAIADVGRVIVDTAKAEVEFMKATGAKSGTGFVSLPEVVPAAPAGRQLTDGNGGRSYKGGRGVAGAGANGNG